MEFAEDLLYSFGNSDESSGSDEESSDEFMDNLLRFLSDDESDTEFQFSPGMLLESHAYLPFDEQMDVETDASHSTPLYENAPLSVAASWQAIMGFSLANHLPYTAMAQLLNLLKIHVPSAHSLPKSLNSFKKHFIIDEAQPQQRFCSLCFRKLKPEEKHCSQMSCRDNKADVCYFVSVPITAHLKQIVEGTCKYKVHTLRVKMLELMAVSVETSLPLSHAHIHSSLSSVVCVYVYACECMNARTYSASFYLCC